MPTSAVNSKHPLPSSIVMSGVGGGVSLEYGTANGESQETSVKLFFNSLLPVSFDLSRAPRPCPSDVLLSHWDVNSLPNSSSTKVWSTDFGTS